MNEVLRPILRSFALVFFNDILVYSPDLGAHLRHLREVLWLLVANQLEVNQKQCSLRVSHVEYLGHVVLAEGVAADPSKMKVVSKWPIPTNIKGLRGFLGLTRYYRRFI